MEATSAAPTETAPEHRHPAPEAQTLKARLTLALAALGVVYGDLGTNILFAIRECFKPEPDCLLPTTANVLSVLSLLFWALILVVVVKYLSFILRADNRGEGGILALLALLLSHEKSNDSAGSNEFSRRNVLMLLGIFGTSLLLADGMITPSISVLSAVEGLGVVAPGLRKVVAPVTVFILIGLFLVQRFGTEWLGKFFGPVMLIWFVTIGLVGLPWIIRYPVVLTAFDPRYILTLFRTNPWPGFFLLGAIILVIAGAEALYADMGHFGRKPIRLAWYFVAFPGLLLNYFGQGGFILSREGDIFETGPDGAKEVIHLFYSMAPDILLVPLVILATAATVIASQALISGAYSLAEQAIQLGYFPRLAIIHTSGEVMGQIYVPFVNWSLMAACILLVLFFKESSYLANAYGIAIIGTMVITSLLFFEVTRKCWKWGLVPAVGLLALFLSVDVPFLISNLAKVMTGGWVPLLVGAGLWGLMVTWHRCRELLHDSAIVGAMGIPLKAFLDEHLPEKCHRDEETAVAMTATEDVVPKVLLETIRRMGVVPGRLVLLTVKAAGVPRVAAAEAVEVREYSNGCFGVTARHGFMEKPNVPRFLELCAAKGLQLDPNQVYYYLSRMTLVPTGTAKIAEWRKRLFMLMYHNARPATAFYGLPPNRVVELGRLVEF